MDTWVTILTSVGTLVTTIVAVTTITNLQIKALRNEMIARFDAVDRRFDAVDRRLDALEARVNLIEAHLLGVKPS